MKYTVILFLAIISISCNSINVKNSREKLLKYEQEGYAIKLNDSLIKIKRVFLDEKKIKEIEIDKQQKIITLVREKSYLNLAPMSFFITDKNEGENLIVIDGSPIQGIEMDSTVIEVSAIKSVQVLKNTSSLHGKDLKKVITVKTNNNDR